MRRVWSLAALALACTRENPGFLLAGDDASGASATPATTTTTTTATLTGTSDASDGGTTRPETTGEPLPTCPLWAEPALDLQFTYKGEPLAPAPDCPPTIYRGNGVLTTNTLTLLDDGLCGDNLAGTFELVVGSVAVSLPIIKGCFEVELAWTDDCSAVRSTLLHYFVLGQKLLIAAGIVGSDLAPPGAPELRPRLELDGPCACDPATTTCCALDDGLPPGTYRLNFTAPGVVLRPGEAAQQVALGDAVFNLENLRSHVHPDCSDAPLHLDWFAVRASE